MSEEGRARSPGRALAGLSAARTWWSSAGTPATLACKALAPSGTPYCITPTAPSPSSRRPDRRHKATRADRRGAAGRSPGRIPAGHGPGRAGRCQPGDYRRTRWDLGSATPHGPGQDCEQRRMAPAFLSPETGMTHHFRNTALFAVATTIGLVISGCGSTGSPAPAAARRPLAPARQLPPDRPARRPPRRRRRLRPAHLR